ncbi:MAG: cadherin-like beta sandwich domain-containing protein [Paludibacter sp.]|nr:cadherin-like beta sandwich domain-containing protein [Paludibacter sp.]
MKKMLLSKLLIISSFLFAVGVSAQTLTHSYTFEAGTWSGTTVNDQVGSVNGTVNGTNWEIKNGYFYNHNANQNATNQGGYISFDGTALNLSSYSAITLEVYLSLSNDFINPRKWSECLYFGGASGANSIEMQLEMNSTTQSRVGVNNAQFVTFTPPAKATTHHYVIVVVPSTASSDGSLTVYQDGVSVGTVALAAGSYDTVLSGLSTANANLGKGGWSNPLTTYPIHEFNIYSGAMDAATVANRYQIMNSKLASVSLGTGTLNPVFDGDVLNYAVVLPAGTNSLTVGATASSSTNYSSVIGAGTYDVSADYGTITLKASATGIPYCINWRKSVNSPVLTHSYTFTDGTAADIIGGDNGTTVGTGIIANGLFTTSAGANLISGTSQYISLPASNISINNYPAVTFETVAKIASTSANTFYSFFGNNTIAGQNNSNTVGNGIDYVYLHSKDFITSCNINYQPWVGTTVYSATTNLNDNKAHHIVGIMTMDSLILYRDGVLSGKVLLSNLNKLFNIDPKVGYIFRSGYPNDQNTVGSVGEFNIWKGQLTDATIATRYNSYMKDAALSGITLSAGSISFDPAVTSYNVSVSSSTTSVTIGATSSKDYVTISGTGETVLTSGTGTATITVTAADGTTTKTYTLNFSPTTDFISSKSSEFNAYVESGKLVVYTESNFSVFNTLGKKVAQRNGSHTTQQIELMNGVYFVKSNGVTIKVIVR